MGLESRSNTYMTVTVGDSVLKLINILMGSISILF